MDAQPEINRDQIVIGHKAPSLFKNFKEAKPDTLTL